MMTRRMLLLFFLGVLTLALLGWHLLAGAPEMPTIRFYGRVIDEAGLPVAGADIFVAIWKVPLPWSSSKGPPLAEATSELRITSDDNGNFSVIGQRGYMLQILDARKPAYVWVVDLSWTLPADPTRLVDNRFFLYAGSSSIYVPDEARPAIFPLHHTG